MHNICISRRKGMYLLLSEVYEVKFLREARGALKAGALNFSNMPCN